MSEPAGAECRGEDGHCITCSDEGTPMRLLELAEGTARCVADRGVIRAIAVDRVGGVEPGERLLAHAGVALTRLEGERGAPDQVRLEAGHDHVRLEAERGPQDAGATAPRR